MGEFPHPAGVIQVMDDKAFDAILSQKIPKQGLLVDFDHYSDLTNDEREAVSKLGLQFPSKAAGWLKKFTRKVVDGVARLYADVDFTPEGDEAIANKSYLYTSPVHPGHALEYLGDGKVRPLAISKVALTNEPNIRAIGPILANRATLALANSEGKEPGDLLGDPQELEAGAEGKGQKAAFRNRTPGANMEQIAQALGCEATEEAVLAAIEPLKAAAELANRAAAEAAAQAEEARKAEMEALKNRAEAAEKALADMKAAQEQAAFDAKVSAELAKYPDLPNRAEAEAVLRKDFELGAKFLAGLPKPAAPAANSVPGQVPEDLSNREKKPASLFNTGR